MPPTTVDFDAARAIGAELPDVRASTGKLGMALKLKRQILACQAIHKSAEPDSLMIRLGFERRDALLAQDADTFYLTGHYAPYPVVLVRLPRVSRTSLTTLLADAWKFVRGEAQ